MAWKLNAKPQTVKVTKELAQRYAEMDPAPHDRPLSERRLQVYRKLWKEGQFRPVTWATALCLETGVVYRVNGKHTSTMLASHLGPMPDFYAVVEEYLCDTLEDVAYLYSTFDSKMQSRSADDIYQSFAATIPELQEISGKVIRQLVQGIGYQVLGAIPYEKASHTERAELLFDHVDFALWVDKLFTAGRCDEKAKMRAAHLRRQATIAAMLATYQRDQEAASRFWVMVRDETGVTPDTPDRVLARYLISSSIRGHSGARSAEADTQTTREMYVKCLHAWNAWRQGGNTKLRYYAEAELPEAR